MALILKGRVVSFDGDDPMLPDGAVYVSDDGLVEAVQPARDAPPPGFDAAPRVDTDGVLYPGLIDLHNHVAYNFRSLWFPPREEPYTSREQWPNEESYRAEISLPANALGMSAGKAVLKFGEVKALVGGVTAIQGSAKFSRPYEGWLVRNIEFETFGTGEKTIYQSVRTLGGDDFAAVRDRMRDGASFIYHLAEGTSPGLLDEYHDLRDQDCLSERLIAIHCTALGDTEFREWGEIGGAVVWSPFSNLWLYRATTDVVSARDRGLLVCLGADWAPSGSKNVLGELKVADLWNRKHLDRSFTDRELCEMATTNPARALGWQDRVGRIAPGLFADIVVVRRRRDDDHRNLIQATERDVLLVLVGGRPVYGIGSLLALAGVSGAEPIYVAGVRRAIQMLDPAITDADITWAQVVAQLEWARKNPGVAPVRAFGEEPLRLIPDMPGDELPALRDPNAFADVVMPPLDTLFHSADFLRDTARASIAGELLSGLAAYYAAG